jgi:hypothetical protein
MLHVNIRGVVRRTEGTAKANEFAEGVEREAKGAGNFAEESRTVERAFFSTMLKNWRTLMIVYPVGTLFFFLDPGRFDIYEFLNLPHNLRSFQILKAGLREKIQILIQLPPLILPYLIVVGVINLLVLIGFAFFLVSRRYPIELKIFILILLGYVILIVAPTGLARFRLSFMPFLFLALPPFLEALPSLKTVIRDQRPG